MLWMHGLSDWTNHPEAYFPLQEFHIAILAL